jgi:hypothetical protein
MQVEVARGLYPRALPGRGLTPSDRTLYQ